MAIKNRLKFHHLGIATKDRASALGFIKDNFEVIEIGDVVYDKNQDATLQMVKTTDVLIELISGKIVDNLIKSNRIFYHICYSTDNLDEAVKGINGAIVVSPPKEAVLFDNNLVAFLLTPIGLIELLEAKWPR